MNLKYYLLDLNYNSKLNLGGVAGNRKWMTLSKK